jgi:hypothetical protein
MSKRIALALHDTETSGHKQKLFRIGLTALLSQLRATAGRAQVEMTLESHTHLNELISRIDDRFKANMLGTAFLDLCCHKGTAAHGFLSGIVEKAADTGRIAVTT